jgi:hypothetical protein
MFGGGQRGLGFSQPLGCSFTSTPGLFDLHLFGRAIADSRQLLA